MAVCVDEQLDVAHLPVLPPVSSNITIQQYLFILPVSLAPGSYLLYVSNGTRTGTPQVALPLADDDGQRRYHLGSIDVQQLENT